MKFFKQTQFETYLPNRKAERVAISHTCAQGNIYIYCSQSKKKKEVNEEKKNKVIEETL